MNKKQLLYLLKSISVGGVIERCVLKYNSKTKELSSRSIAGDNSFFGEVSCISLYDFSSNTETELELDWNNGKDFEIGIYDLDDLIKMVSILDDVELKIEFSKKQNYLSIDDGFSSMIFKCSDISLINQAPPLKRLPDFETLLFTLTDSMNRFRLGFNSLKSDTFNFFINKNSNNKGIDDVIFSIGYSSVGISNRYDVSFGGTRIDLGVDEHTHNSNNFVEVFKILDMFDVVSTMMISNEELTLISNDKKHSPTNEIKYGIKYDYYFIETEKM
jgi:hypothetical protein